METYKPLLFYRDKIKTTNVVRIINVLNVIIFLYKF